MMTQEERGRIIGKIKKCFALAGSSNEHEAAAALKRARALMDKYAISDGDMLAAEATERSGKSRAKENPVAWETTLVRIIGQAFGCRVIFSPPITWESNGEWLFIGCDPAPEVAQYAHIVLMRQIRRARGIYIGSHLKRCKPARKTQRADIFCEAWVTVVKKKVEAFVGICGNGRAIDAYVANHYPKTVEVMPIRRNGGETLREHEWRDYLNGMAAGRQAQLNRACNGNGLQAALLG